MQRERERQVFADLFCGSCNVIAEIDSKYHRIANDKHKYLIAMWKAMQDGWIPPDTCSEEEYRHIKQNKDDDMALSGFIGFACSFGGKWFGGYARRKDAYRNYCVQGKRGNIRLIENMQNVQFENKDYKDLEIPDGAIVYCDIPYKGKAQYSLKECGKFNHDEFYDWVEKNKHRFDIYISEYKESVPDGFEIVWEKESKTDLGNIDNQKIKTTEVLITPI